MPTARQDAGIAVENNMIYVVGGYANGNRLDTVESYNPATNTWTEKAHLLTGKSEPAVGLLGNKIIGFTIVAADGYAASGFTGDNEGYNASANTWRSLTSDRTPRNSPCKGTKGVKMYVAGGADNFGNALSVTEAFNLSTNIWTKKAPLPHATEGPGSAVFQGLLYCFGGWAAFQGAVLNNLQIYHP
jgi:N-acetylneuraminic acid mutarotase